MTSLFLNYILSSKKLFKELKFRRDHLELFVLVTIYYCDVGSPWHHGDCRCKSLRPPEAPYFPGGSTVTVWCASLQTFHIRMCTRMSTHTHTHWYMCTCRVVTRLQLATYFFFLNNDSRWSFYATKCRSIFFNDYTHSVIVM